MNDMQAPQKRENPLYSARLESLPTETLQQMARIALGTERQRLDFELAHRSINRRGHPS